MAMNALQNDAHIEALCAGSRKEQTMQQSQATISMQALSPKEIGVVAGGPEADVGNGITPPR
jgi:hypothetical protein